MFKKKPLVGSKSALTKELTKVTKEYSTKSSTKEAKAKSAWGKLKAGSPPDIGDDGGRAVVEALFDLCTKHAKGGLRPAKWEKSVIDQAVVHYFNDRDQFVFESFTNAVEEMCRPVVLMVGPPNAGKTMFMANITANNFRGKELVYVNWNKLNSESKETHTHHLKSVAICVFVVPLFGSESGTASVAKTLSYLNSSISEFQSFMDGEPQPLFVHLVFNWKSEEQLKEVIPHIDAQALFPSQVVTIEACSPPMQIYSTFLGHCRRLGVNDTRVFTHTIWNDVAKCEQVWQDIWDITTKGPRGSDSDSD